MWSQGTWGSNFISGSPSSNHVCFYCFVYAFKPPSFPTLPWCPAHHQSIESSLSSPRTSIIYQSVCLFSCLIHVPLPSHQPPLFCSVGAREEHLTLNHCWDRHAGEWSSTLKPFMTVQTTDRDAELLPHHLQLHSCTKPMRSFCCPEAHHLSCCPSHVDPLRASISFRVWLVLVAARTQMLLGEALRTCHLSCCLHERRHHHLTSQWSQSCAHTQTHTETYMYTTLADPSKALVSTVASSVAINHSAASKQSLCWTWN